MTKFSTKLGHDSPWQQTKKHTQTQRKQNKQHIQTKRKQQQTTNNKQMDKTKNNKHSYQTNTSVVTLCDLLFPSFGGLSTSFSSPWAGLGPLGHLGQPSDHFGEPRVAMNLALGCLVAHSNFWQKNVQFPANRYQVRCLCTKSAPPARHYSPDPPDRANQLEVRFGPQLPNHLHSRRVPG